MAQRFTILETDEDNAVTTLFRADDSKTQAEVWVRRFKTQDRDAREGLVSLMEALKSAGHPGIETVHEMGSDEEGVFILTSKPEGDTLDQVLEDGPLSTAEFEMVARQLLEGLSSVHDRAVMHGALRAEHVRIVRPQGDGSWKVRIHGFGQGFGATEDGKEPGTEIYLCAAPEQWDAAQARRRTDVYSLGCILYQAAAARPPFAAKTLKELRHKHLKHDVRPLGKLAPQLPSWMSAWVMRLIANNADERPRKAGIALELFEEHGQPKGGNESARIEQGRITDAVQPTIMPLSPGTEPIMKGTSPVVSSSGRPASATSGTIAVPVSKTGRAAIPAVVGRPVRSRVPSTPPTKGSRLPSVILYGALGLVVVAIVGFALFKGVTKEPPVKWGKVRKLPLRLAAQPPRRDALKDPSDRPPPVAADRLMVHLRADAGVDTFSGPVETQAATLGNPVATWHDMGQLGRDNELAFLPWVPERGAIRLVETAAIPANGLARATRFIQFEPKGSPPSCLGISAIGDPNAWPFGSRAKPGLTAAVVFMHPKANTDHMLFALRGKHFTTVLRIAGDNSLRLLAGDSRPTAPEGERAIAMKTQDLDCTSVSVAIVRWRTNPDRVHFTVTNAKGQRYESLTEARKCPDLPLTELSLGGGPLGTYRNPKGKISAYRGGIAEVLLYSAELTDAETSNLDRTLQSAYFK
jgi:serine/threonine protein kinase